MTPHPRDVGFASESADSGGETGAPDRPTRPLEIKLATLTDVREYTEHESVELWFREGRVIVRAWNECLNNHTDVDLGDLIVWLRSAGKGFIEDGGDGTSSLSAIA